MKALILIALFSTQSFANEDKLKENYCFMKQHLKNLKTTIKDYQYDKQGENYQNLSSQIDNAEYSLKMIQDQSKKKISCK